MRNLGKLLGDEWLLSTRLSSDLVLMLAGFIWLRLNGSFNYSVILATCSYSVFQVSGELCVVCAQASLEACMPIPSFRHLFLISLE